MRRTLLTVLLLLTWFVPITSVAADSPPPMTVWKSASCGCCAKWIEHMRSAGFTVEARDVASIDAVKTARNIPGKLRSCHTAEVDGYLIEGHVPASDVARLLSERPSTRGLAVPGMPLGSPGMEGPGGEKDAYDVVRFDADGTTSVFQRH